MPVPDLESVLFMALKTEGAARGRQGELLFGTAGVGLVFLAMARETIPFLHRGVNKLSVLESCMTARCHATFRAAVDNIAGRGPNGDQHGNEPSPSKPEFFGCRPHVRFIHLPRFPLIFLGALSRWHKIHLHLVGWHAIPLPSPRKARGGGSSGNTVALKSTALGGGSYVRNLQSLINIFLLWSVVHMSWATL